MFQCRTRLCGWCSEIDALRGKTQPIVSMPHAALWVVQLYRLEEIIESLEVSMPHAALWVVQQSRKKSTDSWKSCFNAARGFVGGAAL